MGLIWCVVVWAKYVAVQCLDRNVCKTWYSCCYTIYCTDHVMNMHSLDIMCEMYIFLKIYVWHSVKHNLHVINSGAGGRYRNSKLPKTAPNAGYNMVQHYNLTTISCKSISYLYMYICIYIQYIYTVSYTQGVSRMWYALAAVLQQLLRRQVVRFVPWPTGVGRQNTDTSSRTRHAVTFIDPHGSSLIFML